MNYKRSVNPNIENPKTINPSSTKDARNSRLHEVASLLIVAILRMRLRERNKLIKKILGH